MFVYYISIMLLVPTGLLVTEENIFWRRGDCRVDTGIFLARSLSIQMYVGCIEPQYKLWQEENRICLWCWMDIGNKRFFWIKKRYCPLTQAKAAACTDSSSWDADGTGTLWSSVQGQVSGHSCASLYRPHTCGKMVPYIVQAGQWAKTNKDLFLIWFDIIVTIKRNCGIAG